MLDARRLRELLFYDPASGVFTRRITVPRGKAGAVVGFNDGSGYLQIGIDLKKYRAHRLAWLYMTGQWAEQIDHINGNRADNRWCNLRAATAAMNSQNQRRARRDNKSTGLLGAYRNGKRFMSQLLVGGRCLYLGTFDSALQAHEAYIAAKRKQHEGCTL